jgi:hypothetical protein
LAGACGCARVVHEAPPTIANSTSAGDGHQLLTLADLPTTPLILTAVVDFRHSVSDATIPPPTDVVVEFHRLVI